jgi:hypothetical protein
MVAIEPRRALAAGLRSRLSLPLGTSRDTLRRRPGREVREPSHAGDSRCIFERADVIAQRLGRAREHLDHLLVSRSSFHPRCSTRGGAEQAPCRAQSESAQGGAPLAGIVDAETAVESLQTDAENCRGLAFVPTMTRERREDQAPLRVAIEVPTFSSRDALVVVESFELLAGAALARDERHLTAWRKESEDRPVPPCPHPPSSS